MTCLLGVCVSLFVSALPDLIPNPTYGTAVNPTFGGEASLIVMIIMIIIIINVTYMAQIRINAANAPHRLFRAIVAYVIRNVFSRLRNTDSDVSIVEVQLVNYSTRPDH